MPSLKILCWGDSEKLFAGRDSFLCREDCEVLLASSMREVLELAQQTRPNAILIDHDLAGQECESLCRSLKKGRRTSVLPVIVMTSLEAADPPPKLEGVVEILQRPGQNEISQALARAIGVAARKFPRFQMEAPARLQTEEREGEIDSRALDISLEGVQLEVDQPFKLGCQVQVSLSLPVGREPLSLRAKVVRIFADPIWGKDRLGLQFLQPDETTLTRLQTLLQSLAEAQEKLSSPQPDEPRNRYIF